MFIFLLFSTGEKKFRYAEALPVPYQSVYECLRSSSTTMMMNDTNNGNNNNDGGGSMGDSTSLNYINNNKKNIINITRGQQQQQQEDIISTNNYNDNNNNNNSETTSMISTKEINYLIDLKASEYSTLSSLQQLGLQNLKFQLESRGMKCSGNLQERAERLFSIRDLTSLDQIHPKLLKKK
jgi:hypothetical protein